ncbi:MAG: hypothetical protein U9N87_08565 [Planctomycetota bacterium]|nr:hypothetical protein [Planctomycetota bacterium]
MRIVSISLCLTALLAINVPLTGCGDKTAEPKKDKDASAALSHDGHDHCDHDATHQHSCEGPHGGHLIELGDKAYQAKLLRDEKTNTVTVHLLDATGEKTVATAQAEITLQLLRDGKFVEYVLKAAAVKDAAKKGTASQFEIVDEKLVDSLDHDKKTKSRLQVTIDGKPYSGIIELSGHDHGDHDHGKHNHGDDTDHDDDHKH